MKSYSHLNILVDTKLYGDLRRYSRRLDVPISKVTREALAEFLSTRTGKNATTPQE